MEFHSLLKKLGDTLAQIYKLLPLGIQEYVSWINRWSKEWTKIEDIEFKNSKYK